MVAVLVLLCVSFKCDKFFQLVFCCVVCQLLLVLCGCCVQAVICYYGVFGMQTWCVSTVFYYNCMWQCLYDLYHNNKSVLFSVWQASTVQWQDWTYSMIIVALLALHTQRGYRIAGIFGGIKIWQIARHVSLSMCTVNENGRFILPRMYYKVLYSILSNFHIAMHFTTLFHRKN